MYQITELKSVAGLFHAFSTAEEGNMSFRYGTGEEVVKNREKFLGGAGVDPASCVSYRILDKNVLLTVDKSHVGRGMDSPESAFEADGLFTREPGVYLFLFIADCVPLILFDTKNKVLGLVHVGRYSAGTQLPERSTRYMTTEFNSRAPDIIAAVGPAISKDSYIKRDVPELADPRWQSFLHEEEEGLRAIDLKGYITAQLKECGVKDEHIVDAGVDTATDPRFFSHYRAAKLGYEEARFACVAGIA